MLQILALALVAYLLGSVPFGFITANARGVDLRQIGSGNIGTTNVYRALGFRMALVVFVLDLCKGFAATRLLPVILTGEFSPIYLRLICGFAVMIGSVAGVFMRFRGGKGVATAVGVFLGLQPLATAICIGIWAALVAKFRYVSLGSICGAVALPILIVALNRYEYASNPVFYLAVVVAIVIVIRHRVNIKRLVEGRESRIGRVEGRP